MGNHVTWLGYCMAYSHFAEYVVSGWTLCANRNPKTFGPAHNARNKTCVHCVRMQANGVKWILSVAKDNVPSLQTTSVHLESGMPMFLPQAQVNPLLFLVTLTMLHPEYLDFGNLCNSISILKQLRIANCNCEEQPLKPSSKPSSCFPFWCCRKLFSWGIFDQKGHDADQKPCQCALVPSQCREDR